MNKRKRIITRLIDLYYSHRFSNKLEKDIQGWLGSSAHGEEKDEALKQVFDSMVSANPHPSKKAFRELRRIRHLLKLESGRGSTISLRTRRVWQVAAVVIPVMLIVGTLLLLPKKDGVGTSSIGLVMIAAGNTEQKNIVLPDSSSVWINYESSIEYPEQFGTERRLALKGEAYFKIERDEQAPFIVETDHLTVKVLGTEFNIYEEAFSSAVTLTKGKVEVSAGNQVHIMDKPAKLVFDHVTGEISLHPPITGQSGDWRGLNFEYAPLSEVFAAMEQRFNIRIEFPAEFFDSEMVTIKLRGHEMLDEVLGYLSDITGRFIYRTHSDRVTIELIK